MSYQIRVAERIVGYDYDGNPIYRDDAAGTTRVDKTASEDEVAGSGNAPKSGNPRGDAVQVVTPPPPPAPPPPTAGQNLVTNYQNSRQRLIQQQGHDDSLALADEFLNRLNQPQRPPAPGELGAPPPPSPAPPAGGINQTALDPYREERAAALADQRRVLDTILGLQAPAPLTEAERSALRTEYADNALAAAQAQANGAPGGAGARQESRIAVNQQTPQIQGEAARQARAEAAQLERERLDRYLGDVQRLGTAANLTNTIGQTAINQFGQEAGLATTDAELGVRVWEGLMKDSGLDKQLAQMDRQLALDNQKFIGSMVLDLQRLGFDYAKLSAEQEEALFDNLVQIYGIDKQAATAIKVAAKNKSRDVLDYIAVGASVIDAVGGLIPGSK